MREAKKQRFTTYIKHSKVIYMILRYYLRNKYILFTIFIKKRQRLKNYFSKEINVKRVTEIAGLLQEQSNFPDWYNAQILDAREILGCLLETKANTTDDNINKLKEFWNVLRFYQGIKELENKKAIYKVIPFSQAIVVKMRTYIVIDFVKRALMIWAMRQMGMCLMLHGLVYLKQEKDLF